MRPQNLERYKITKEELIHFYVNLKYTRRQIAELFDVSESLVKYYMKQYGIEARDRHSYKRSDSAILATSTKQWQGYGEISLTYYNQIKHGSIRHSRVLDFNVSIEFLWELFLKQNRKCALSGLSLTFAPIGKGIYKAKLQTASLDRIDSCGGYTEDNVQWIHKDIQRMKMDFSTKRLIELCGYITHRHEGCDKSTEILDTLGRFFGK